MVFISRVTFYENCECVEIFHKKLVNGEWARYSDYIYTKPKGDWIEIRFKETDQMEYTDFLETMVVWNHDVAKKLARLVSTVNDSWDDQDKISAMHAIKILDPTFTPPYINLRCKWQRRLLDDLIGPTVTSIIDTCKNEKRLGKYYEAMK